MVALYPQSPVAYIAVQLSTGWLGWSENGQIFVMKRRGSNREAGLYTTEMRMRSRRKSLTQLWLVLFWKRERKNEALCVSIPVRSLVYKRPACSLLPPHHPLGRSVVSFVFPEATKLKEGIGIRIFYCIFFPEWPLIQPFFSAVLEIMDNARFWDRFFFAAFPSLALLLTCTRCMESSKQVWFCLSVYFLLLKFTLAISLICFSIDGGGSQAISVVLFDCSRRRMKSMERSLASITSCDFVTVFRSSMVIRACCDDERGEEGSSPDNIQSSQVKNSETGRT